MEEDKEIMMKKIKSFCIPLLLMISIAVYPVIFMYCKNISEINFLDILFLLLGFVGVSILIWLICKFIIKETYKSTLIAFFFVIIISNYMLIQKGINIIAKNLKYWHILPITIVIFLHVAYFIKKKVKEENVKDIVNVLLVVVVGLLIINYIPVVPKAIQKVNSGENRKKDIDFVEKEGPNVYWMVFDECASFPTIEKYYGYSNKDMYDFLVESKFKISDSSRNECGNTVAVLTNCLNLDYVVNSSMDATQMSEYRVNPMLTTIMKDEGYTVRGVGDTEWLGIPSVSYSGAGEAQTVEGFGVNQLVLQNTIFGPFVEYDGTQSSKLVLDTIKYMKDGSNFIPNSAQFNIMYLNSPHQPFLFDENGEAVQPANYNNWDDDTYYLGQYKFIMKEMKNIVSQILKNDPNSIMILSSDHGPRFKEEIPYEDKINVLNAVYFMGENIDEIDGKSGVNTLRTVINKLFQYDLQDVEVKDGE